MPYKDPEKERACGRRRYERITAERIARGMCPEVREGEARARSDLVPALRRKASQGRARKMREGQGGWHTIRRQRRGNGAGRLRVTGAGSAIGRGRTPARARAAVQIRPLKAARCANRAAWHGVTGSGNNMPRGVPPVCAAGAVRRCPVMPPAATGAPGARPNVQEKRRRMQEAASATPGGAHGGFVQTAAHHPRARPGVPRAPAGPGRVRASIAVCRFCHHDSRSSRSPRA